MRRSRRWPGTGLTILGALLAGAPAAASTYVCDARISGSDSVAGDLFGTAVALSGDVVVVGAPEAATAAGTGAGAAYVFVRSGSSWTEQQKLTAADGLPNQNFGFAV